MRILSRLFLVLSLGLMMALYVSCGGGDSESGTTYYADADGDGYGDAAVSQVLDAPQAGWVSDSTDCDDNLTAVNPGAQEVCDDWTDDNCDDLLDCYDDASCAGTAACLGCVDADSDGYYAVTLDCFGGNDCDDADDTINPGVDADGDTLDVCEDCDDADPTKGSSTAEVCNDFDDDCDGETDEASPGVPLNQTCYTGAPSTRGVGECSDGTRVCASGTWGFCAGQVRPSAEICDGLDNNCDGAIDESFPEDGQPCTVPGQQGACSQSAYSACNSGTLVCPQVVFQSPELCNGLDDDCDGTADDGLTGSLCPEQDGVCAGSVETCGGSAGWLACSDSSYGPSYEVSEFTCDDLDNDCDGVADDNLTAPPCAKQLGVCAGSTKTCGGGSGWLICDAADYGADYEVDEVSCDGLDNDCDGVVDNGADADCGPCQRCSSSGTCVDQIAGQDLKDECGDYNCTDYVYGWGFPVNTCRTYAGPTPLNGNCDGAGACADVTQACDGPGDLLISCDVGCTDQCPTGALASDYDTPGEVCFTDGQPHDCSTGVCDTTGTCSSP